MLGPDALSFILFISLVAIFVYRERKHIKFLGFMLMRKTKRGRGLIDRLARPKNFWNKFSVIGIGVAFVGMAFISYTFLVSIYKIVLSYMAGQVVQSPGYFVFPTYATQTSIVPGAILIPWFRWLVAISLIIIPHEFFHGIMARANGIKIKSLGWALFLFFIPVAFVEPDEKQLNKAKMSTKLRVFSAGSFANFLVSLLFIVLFLGFQSVLLSGVTYATDQGMIEPSGIYFADYFKDGGTYPAEEMGIKGALMSIGDYQIKSVDDISSAMSNYRPGDNVRIVTTEGVYNVTLAKSPDNATNAFLGISSPYKIYYEAQGPLGPAVLTMLGLGVELHEIIYLVFLLSLFIGLVNLLPVVPLDGGLMVKAVRDNYKGVVRKACNVVIYLMSAVTLVIFGIIFYNLVSFILI